MPNRKSHLAYADFISLFIILAKKLEYIMGSIQLPKSTIYRKALLITKKHLENTCKEGSGGPV